MIEQLLLAPECQVDGRGYGGGEGLNGKTSSPDIKCSKPKEQQLEYQ